MTLEGRLQVGLWLGFLSGFVFSGLALLLGGLGYEPRWLAVSSDVALLVSGLAGFALLGVKGAERLRNRRRPRRYSSGSL